MAKPTPSQLQEAKRKKAEEKEAQQMQRRERLNWLAEAEKRHRQLESVLDGIYDEADKLSRKWPNMPVTQLTLDKTNKALQAVRQLLKDENDDFVEGMNEIVPAGDMPECRDIVLVLRGAKEALKRFERQHRDEWSRL